MVYDILIPTFIHLSVYHSYMDDQYNIEYHMFNINGLINITILLIYTNHLLIYHNVFLSHTLNIYIIFNIDGLIDLLFIKYFYIIIDQSNADDNQYIIWLLIDGWWFSIDNGIERSIYIGKHITPAYDHIDVSIRIGHGDW